MEATVQIPCPRCDGHGENRNWHPDAGVCYRCGGRQVVQINIARHQAALRHLRAKYMSIARSLREVLELGVLSEAEELRTALGYCEQSGLRVRADLEAAGVKVV
jgi:hypothetical protein